MLIFLDMEQKLNISLKHILYTMIGVFLPIAGYFFLPSTFASEHTYLFKIVAVLSLIFLILGIYVIKEGVKEKGNLKKYLLITGISAVCPLVCTLLHNLFYMLEIQFENLSSLFANMSVIFFLTALIGAPIFFVIGVTASLLVIHKEEK
jgi:hypothetical protein